MNNSEPKFLIKDVKFLNNEMLFKFMPIQNTWAERFRYGTRLEYKTNFETCGTCGHESHVNKVEYRGFRTPDGLIGYLTQYQYMPHNFVFDVIYDLQLYFYSKYSQFYLDYECKRDFLVKKNFTHEIQSSSNDGWFNFYVQLDE